MSDATLDLNDKGLPESWCNSEAQILIERRVDWIYKNM